MNSIKYINELFLIYHLSLSSFKQYLKYLKRNNHPINKSMSSRENLQIAEKEEPLNIEKMKNAIEVGKKIITGVEGDVKKLIIMIGKSGAGKSTSIAALSGEKLKAFSELDRAILIDKDHIKDQSNNLIKRKHKVYIGTTAQAATSEPVFVKLATGYYLVDIPGFRDNKGVTQIVINAYYISRIFNMFEKISLFFTIELQYLISGDRGQRLCKSFLEFVDILGSVSAFSKSFSLLITKARISLSQIQIREKLKTIMNQVASIRKNEKLKQLFELIISGQVPILVICEPDLLTKKSVSYENAVDVTDQYTEVINEAKVIMDNLEPHRFLKIYPPKLTIEDLTSCLQFVQGARTNITSLENTFVKNLEDYMRSSLTLKNVETGRWEEVFEPIRKGTEFFKNLQFCLQPNNPSMIQSWERILTEKERLFNFLNKFERLVVNEQYFKGLNISALITELKDNFIMIDFLSIFDFRTVHLQLGNWIQPKNIIIQFFGRLDFRYQIQQFYTEIDRQLEAHSKLLINNFLTQAPSSKSFRILKKQSRILPNYFLRITKYDKSQNLQQFISDILNLQNDQINFDTNSISRLDQMIKTQRKFLNDRQPRLNLKEDWKSSIKITGDTYIQQIFHENRWSDKQKKDGQNYFTRNQQVKNFKHNQNLKDNSSDVRLMTQGPDDEIEMILQLRNRIEYLTQENQKYKKKERDERPKWCQKCCCEIM